MMRSWPLLQTGFLLLLSIACVGMAGIIYAELTTNAAGSDELASPSAAPAQPKPRSADAGARFSLPPLQNFAAVTERPLFAQSRRPPPQGSDDSLGPWSSLVLAGIVISPTSREALILHGKPQVMVHLQEGQDVEGWVVTSIQPDRVVLRGGATEHELKLLEKPPAPTPTPGLPRRSFNP